MRRILFLICMTLLLANCATKLSPERTESEQQEVKEQVMEALKDYYKQPFKLESFKYEYKTHYPDGSCSGVYCSVVKLGQYILKVQAIDNPIIKFEVVINDKEKESIK